MLNVEKYRDDLKEVGTNFAVTIDGEVMDCQCGTIECKNCIFYKKLCCVERIEWLTSEYEEPILTSKEKAYLKNVIEPRKKDIVDITKWKFHTEKDIEYFTVIILMKNPHTNLCIHLLDFITTEDMPFENLELYKHYTLEELDL